jgi:hypothetical protein
MLSRAFRNRFIELAQVSQWVQGKAQVGGPVGGWPPTENGLGEFWLGFEEAS